MTRVRVSLLILTVLVCASIVSGSWICRSCREFQMRTIAIEETYLSGDSDGAYDMAVGLEEDWESFRTPASVLLSNASLSEIDRITSRVRYKTVGGGELLPELAELRHMLEQLRNSVIPRPSAIF